MAVRKYDSEYISVAFSSIRLRNLTKGKKKRVRVTKLKTTNHFTTAAAGVNTVAPSKTERLFIKLEITEIVNKSWPRPRAVEVGSGRTSGAAPPAYGPIFQRLKVPYLKRKKRNPYMITLLSVCPSVRPSVKTLFLRNAWRFVANYPIRIQVALVVVLWRARRITQGGQSPADRRRRWTCLRIDYEM
ncbi:hypothetical protein EVAR_75680_1 [Eumeta japonica]|uniref:Uncharacterized protein n=1 Tax=Eumeta variegata TaxID=151549 RepID=A0A4C1W2N8_EUMVA|nr:hypothetical protein EVAR_75680_1 [Eumeta japonica]